MNTSFIVNDYVLVWNLLFGASISEKMYEIKQKIWNTYKSEYNNMHNDKKQIMEDYKNFIPNDDTIYNIVFDSNEYKLLFKQTEKYRKEIMNLWDKNKKETNYLINKILRLEIPETTIFVVNKDLNVIEYNEKSNIIIGKEIDYNEPLKILLALNMAIVKNQIKDYSIEDQKFKETILELAIVNEYLTRITKKSQYHLGNKNNLSLKIWLYPYWLMYMGVPKEELKTYMERDNIVFDESKYAYEKELKKMNIEEFIDFCVRNKRYIVRDVKKPKIIGEYTG